MEDNVVRSDLEDFCNSFNYEDEDDKLLVKSSKELCDKLVEANKGLFGEIQRDMCLSVKKDDFNGDLPYDFLYETFLWPVYCLFMYEKTAECFAMFYNSSTELQHRVLILLGEEFQSHINYREDLQRNSEIVDHYFEVNMRYMDYINVFVGGGGIVDEKIAKIIKAIAVEYADLYFEHVPNNFFRCTMKCDWTNQNNVYLSKITHPLRDHTNEQLQAYFPNGSPYIHIVFFTIATKWFNWLLTTLEPDPSRLGEIYCELGKLYGTGVMDDGEWWYFIETDLDKAHRYFKKAISLKGSHYMNALYQMHLFCYRLGNVEGVVKYGEKYLLELNSTTDTTKVLIDEIVGEIRAHYEEIMDIPNSDKLFELVDLKKQRKRLYLEFQKEKKNFFVGIGMSIQALKHISLGEPPFSIGKFQMYSELFSARQDVGEGILKRYRELIEGNNMLSRMIENIKTLDHKTSSEL